MKAIRAALAIGAVFCFLTSMSAFAAPLGVFSLANVTPGGGVSVSASGIDWQPPTGGGFGDFLTGGSTNITYSGGSLTSSTNPFGQIKDLTFTPGPVVNFIQWYTPATTTIPTPPGTGVIQQYPAFDIAAITPGGAAQGALNNCAGVTALGVSCSPLLTTGPAAGTTSFFVLTNRPNGVVDVSVNFVLNGRDANGAAIWAGGYTTQVTNGAGCPGCATASDVQARINSGGSIFSTYSGQFFAQAIPEPASMLLVGGGMMLLGLVSRRRRK